ncbi:MAG: STAS domain-containing protein [Betaproteobacteria bacterium]|jgi:phospholipid transport system transporter-binding protein|nr:STAS domain-containing protein [Betaproteobacteria bacterium]NBT67349.1 STAS domain-containing protein [Betaproteobacteria bacterium]NBY09024.1 STAS domain-containing protein [Betaproteobacteria bacterium]
MKALQLPAQLTGLQAQGQWDQFKSQITPHDAIVINGSALIDFDSSALAFLLACLRQAKQVGSTCQITGLPPLAHSLAKVYGVDQLLA